MKGGQFKATATLNRELQDGESVDWSLEGNNISALATITSDENNTKEAMIEIKEIKAPIGYSSSNEIIKEAIKMGGTTIKSYTSSLGVTGRFQQNLKVHKKEGEPCSICSTPINLQVFQDLF